MDHSTKILRCNYLPLFLITIFCLNLVKISIAAATTRSQSAAAESPTIKIGQGTLKGSVGVTRGGKHFSQFLGIPYAAKPARFQLAGPPPTWSGVRDGTKFGSKCIQYRREVKEIFGDEDCLFLNVFSPKFPQPGSMTVVPDPAAPLLPVFVFIHGGSFLFFSGEVFEPKYLLDEPVILVTFNYRLGALGFLNTGDRSGIVPNLGLKDQVAALQWVRDNIEKFGGDKDRVTIFGNSAGSASVSYHVLSPMSKNLFNFAISQSGVATCPWAFVPSPEKVVKNLAEKLTCPTNTSKELVECLKSKSAKEIVAQQQKILGTLAADPPVPFAPSAENNFVQTRAESSKFFLADDPQKMLTQQNFNTVPYIIGVNSVDGLTFAAASILNNSRLVEQLDKNWDMITPAILAYGSSAPDPKEISMRVRQFYFGKDKISEKNPRHLQKLTELLSDRNFFQCSQNFAVQFAKKNHEAQAQVFLYHFERDNGYSFLDHFGPTTAQEIKGAKHQDEIQYFTASPYFPEITSKDPKALKFSQDMVKLWTSLGIDGKPTKTWGSAKTWPPLLSPADNENLKWYHFGNEDTRIGTVPFESRIQFWNGLPLTKEHPRAPPFIVGELRKSPVPPPQPILASPKPATAGPLTIGHSGLNHGPPPQALPPITPPPNSKVTMEASMTTKKVVATAATTPQAVAVHSHVFPDAGQGERNMNNNEATTTTTTKAPGILSKFFGK